MKPRERLKTKSPPLPHLPARYPTSSIPFALIAAFDLRTGPSVRHPLPFRGHVLVADVEHRPQYGSVPTRGSTDRSVCPGSGVEPQAGSQRMA